MIRSTLIQEDIIIQMKLPVPELCFAGSIIRDRDTRSVIDRTCQTFRERRLRCIVKTLQEICSFQKMGKKRV